MTEKQKALLAELGFTPCKNGGVYDAVCGEVYGKDTLMRVSGDHADDYAILNYADCDHGQGFFYISTLLGGLSFYSCSEKYNPFKTVKDVERYLSIGGVEVKPVGDDLCLFVKCDLSDEEETKECLGEMYKLIGALDYVLTKKKIRIENKIVRENEQ